MNFEKLSELLFPSVKETTLDLEKRFPKRSLKEGAIVTRIAPSPTGFMHLGNLYGAIADERLARQSGGIFYLRIEDTDEKREVEGGVSMIIEAFKDFGLTFDEGAALDGETGDYGPYRQRSRREIYHVVAKHLTEKGFTYPCFCTEQELLNMRSEQENEKANFGYYGKWAVHRDISFEEAERRINAGEPYVLRFKSAGDPNQKDEITDAIKGTLSFPQNDQDVVLLKSDGIPTYHFAHVVDDHFMRTGIVVRGEEWLATLPVHVQLFKTLEWEKPTYAHTAQLMKMENGGKRKLSKRKDPELALSFYKEEGYLKESVLEYLLTLLNSNFEEWRIANPNASYLDFPFSASKMGTSGALFDMEKLIDVSKNVISKMTAEDVLDSVLLWSKDFDKTLYTILNEDKEKALRILSIGRGGEKPRKDLAKWNEVFAYLKFFYDGHFKIESPFPENISNDDRQSIINEYINNYPEAADQKEWFDKVKIMAEKLGFAPETKLYKKNPESYKGHVGDVSQILRIAITGRGQAPDLFAVTEILGKDETIRRLEAALKI